ncbi:unnamed protein product [Closterium sp. Yama58-4]|nr:unnamed protein product [Closterium sp. Yama58-4]
MADSAGPPVASLQLAKPRSMFLCGSLPVWLDREFTTLEFSPGISRSFFNDRTPGIPKVIPPPVRPSLDTHPPAWLHRDNILLPVDRPSDPPGSTWGGSYLQHSGARKCEALAVRGLAEFGEDAVDVIAPADVLKQLFKLPFSKASLFVSVHRVGRTLVLNPGGLAEFGEDAVDVIAPADVLKQLFKLPFSKASLFVSVHRVGRTLVLNPGEYCCSSCCWGKPYPEVDVIAPADVLKQLFKLPFSKASLFVSVHRVGRTLVLNPGPVRSGGRDSARGRAQAAVQVALFQGQPVCQRAPSPSPADVLKQLFKLPFSKASLYVSVHRVGRTLVLNPGACGRAQAAVQAALLQGQPVPPADVLKQLFKLPFSKASLAASEASEDAVDVIAPADVLKQLFKLPFSKGQPVRQRAPRRPHPCSEPRFEHLRLFLGCDLILFSNEKHAAVSLHLVDVEHESSPLVWLDIWLDNLMAGVPELAICYHHKGAVQGYELLHCDDVFLLKCLARDGSASFYPHAVRDSALAILAFLQEKCARSPGTYWPRHGTYWVSACAGSASWLEINHPLSFPHAVSDSALAILGFLQDKCARSPGTYWLRKDAGTDVLQLFDLTPPLQNPSAPLRLAPSLAAHPSASAATLSHVSRTSSSSLSSSSFGEPTGEAAEARGGRAREGAGEAAGGRARGQAEGNSPLPSLDPAVAAHLSLPLAMLLYRLALRLSDSHVPRDRHRTAQLFGYCLQLLHQKDHPCSPTRLSLPLAMLLYRLALRLSDSHVPRDRHRTAQLFGYCLQLLHQKDHPCPPWYPPSHLSLPLAMLLYRLALRLSDSHVPRDRHRMAQLFGYCLQRLHQKDHTGFGAVCGDGRAFGVVEKERRRSKGKGRRGAKGRGRQRMGKMEGGVEAGEEWGEEEGREGDEDARSSCSLGSTCSSVGAASAASAASAGSAAAAVTSGGVVTSCSAVTSSTTAVTDRRICKLIALLGEAYLGLAEAYKGDGQVGRALRAAELACVVVGGWPWDLEDLGLGGEGEGEEGGEGGEGEEGNGEEGEEAREEAAGKVLAGGGECAGWEGSMWLSRRVSGRSFWGELWELVGDLYVDLETRVGVGPEPKQAARLGDLKQEARLGESKQEERLSDPNQGARVGEGRKEQGSLKARVAAVAAEGEASGSAELRIEEEVAREVRRVRKKRRQREGGGHGAGAAAGAGDSGQEIGSKGRGGMDGTVCSVCGRSGCSCLNERARRDNGDSPHPSPSAPSSSASAPAASAASAPSAPSALPPAAASASSWKTRCFGRPFVLDPNANYQSAAEFYSRAAAAFSANQDATSKQAVMRKRGWACNERGRWLLNSPPSSSSSSSASSPPPPPTTPHATIAAARAALVAAAEAFWEAGDAPNAALVLCNLGHGERADAELLAAPVLICSEQAGASGVGFSAAPTASAAAPAASGAAAAGSWDAATNVNNGESGSAGAGAGADLLSKFERARQRYMRALGWYGDARRELMRSVGKGKADGAADGSKDVVGRAGGAGGVEGAGGVKGGVGDGSEAAAARAYGMIWNEVNLQFAHTYLRVGMLMAAAERLGLPTAATGNRRENADSYVSAKDALSKALILYESLGPSRQQEAAFAHFHLADYHRDCALRAASADAAAAGAAAGGVADWQQQKKRLAALAEVHWHKAACFYRADAHPDMFVTICMERAALVFGLGGQKQQWQSHLAALRHLMAAQDALSPPPGPTSPPVPDSKTMKYSKQAQTKASPLYSHTSERLCLLVQSHLKALLGLALASAGSSVGGKKAGDGTSAAGSGVGRGGEESVGVLREAYRCSLKLDKTALDLHSIFVLFARLQ